MAVSTNGFGQDKKKTGYLYGDVVFSAERRGDPAKLASGIIIRFKYKSSEIDIVSNEAGLLDERLPVGKYTLVSARTAEGVSLSFAVDQYKCITIRSGKRHEFDIALLSPEEHKPPT